MPLRHHGRLGSCPPGSGDVGTSCLAAHHGLSISPTLWGHDWVAVPGLPRAGTYTLPRRCSEVTAYPQTFSQNPGMWQGGWPTPDSRVTPPPPQGPSGALLGAGCSWGSAHTLPLLAGAGVGGLGAGECWQPLTGWAGMGRGAGCPGDALSPVCPAPTRSEGGWL